MGLRCWEAPVLRPWQLRLSRPSRRPSLRRERGALSPGGQAAGAPGAPEPGQSCSKKMFHFKTDRAMLYKVWEVDPNSTCHLTP